MKRRVIIQLAVGLALAILAGIGWQWARTFRATTESDRWESHSYLVVEQLEELLSELKDAETGKRGFLITGSTNYLEPYHAALGGIDRKLASVKALTRDDSQQQQRLGRIERLIGDKVAELKEAVEVRATQGFEPARQLVLTGRGKALMDQIRQQINAAQAEETRLLQERTRAKEAYTRRSFQAGIVGGMLSCLLFLSAVILLQRENLRRMGVEWELRQHRDHLEELVDARTRKLRESEEQFRAAFENGAIPMAVTALDCTLLKVNSVFCQLLGYSAAELVGRSYVDISHPDDVAENLCGSERLWRGEIALFRMEKRYIRKDGALLWGDMATAAVRDARGAPLYCVTHIQDITERKRAEEALRESEERFRAMADGTPVMIWVTDAEGGMRFVNRAYCEFLGTTLEAVQRSGWQPLLHPEDGPGYVEAFFAALRERKSFRAQTRVRRHDGAWRWVESSGQPRFSAAGEFVGMAGSSPDVTERVAFQEELERQVAERTAQLAEANANLQHFTHTAAHDLRAPLRGIVSFAELVQARYREQLGTLGRSLMERLVESAELMGRLLDDLLNYSRVTGGELRLEKVPLDRAVRESLGLLDKEVQARQAEVQVAAGLPEVIGHPATVVTVLSNLISNGLKFVPGDARPRVRIWAEQRRMSGLMDNRMIAPAGAPQPPTNPTIPSSTPFVRLWVEDDGIGIAPEDQNRVFASFERLQDKEAYPGTGLGLAIVRKGVERMGGRVGVESELGKGSRFWVELKAAGPAGS